MRDHERKLVYLDSSFVSRIADGSSALSSELIKNSSYAPVFSLSHIIEALPKNVDSIDSSISRLNVIMKEDMNAYFINFFELTNLEIKRNGNVERSDILCHKNQFVSRERLMKTSLLRDNFKKKSHHN